MAASVVTSFSSTAESSERSPPSAAFAAARPSAAACRGMGLGFGLGVGVRFGVEVGFGVGVGAGAGGGGFRPLSPVGVEVRFVVGLRGWVLGAEGWG